MWDFWICLILFGLAISLFAWLDQDLSINPELSEKQAGVMAGIGILLMAVGLIRIW